RDPSKASRTTSAMTAALPDNVCSRVARASSTVLLPPPHAGNFQTLKASSSHSDSPRYSGPPRVHSRTVGRTWSCPPTRETGASAQRPERGREGARPADRGDGGVAVRGGGGEPRGGDPRRPAVHGQLGHPGGERLP